MVRPVSVGFDGSAESLAAAVWAGREAVLRKVPLRVVYALEWRAGNLQFSPGASAQREWVEGRLEVAQEELSQTHPDLAIELERVPEPPVKVLIDAAHASAVLALGSRGLGVVQGFLLGSVSLPVVAHASRPIVVVRAPEVPAALAGDGPVVVSLGLDGPYGPLLGFAFEAAALRGAPLNVVQVREQAGDGTAVAAERDNNDLAEALRPCREKWPAVEVSERPSAGPVAPHLTEAAAHAALLVVGRRKRRHKLGPVPGVRIGPVAHAVLHHATCPVAVVPYGTAGPP
ncbi:universal stress protein [Streptomyces sp. NPDC052396]|uniref:universal stress protein n=1 Tax=Streptomyces sp. NPDC052396 TaxID=3365689 RepID=UPI0037CD242F